jgi:hypothetical protein
MDDKTHEFSLIRANLLCSKGRFEEAQTVLAKILQDIPGDSEALKLQQRIHATQEQEKIQDSRRRMIRYSLKMDTAWRRLFWWVGSLLVGIYCLWSMTSAIDKGNQIGFAAKITTIQRTRGGPWPYTRPVYMDLIFSGFGILLCIGSIAALRIVTPGASQWEELDSDATENRWDRL